jgi:hypothetical protein
MQRYLGVFRAVSILVVVLGLLIFVVQTSDSPSQEMVGLKQLEKQLAVPTPVETKEDDRGTYKDADSKEQTVRSRSFYYTDKAVIEKFVKGLPAQSWVPAEQTNENGVPTVAFAHPERYSCIFVTINDDTAEYQNYIVLRSGSDDACKPVREAFKNMPVQ